MEGGEFENDASSTGQVYNGIHDLEETMKDAVEVLNESAAKLAAEKEALKAQLAAMTERAERLTHAMKLIKIAGTKINWQYGGQVYLSSEAVIADRALAGAVPPERFEAIEKAAVEAEELAFILARKEAEIKDLEKDQARLDWFIANLNKTESGFQTACLGSAAFHCLVAALDLPDKNLRKTIDAAMKET